MATNPPPDVTLAALGGKPRALKDWLITFHLAAVVLDPFTYESAWIIDTAGRLLTHFSAADCRVAWIVTGTPDEARAFLGPWSERILTFSDPDRELVKAVGLAELPALLHFNTGVQVEGAAEGWDPAAWEKVLAGLATAMSWSRPSLPAAGDPAAYAGTPASG